MDYKIIKKIFLDLFKIDKVSYGKTTILTVAHDNDRSFNYKGKFYSPIMDTIEDDLFKLTNEKYISIARIISAIKGDLSYANVKSPEGAFARALLVKSIKGVFMRNTYPYSKMEERIWTKILIDAEPKAVIAILPSRELCVSCRKLGIWVADIQHGVIASLHPWYGEKFRANEPENYLPNSFLVWDKGTEKVLDWVTKKNSTIKIIGNRWLWRFFNKSDSDILVNDIINKNKLKINSNKDKKNILVSLSWGCEDIENKIIPNELINVIMNTNEQFNWLLRLHPNQLHGFASHESKIFMKIYNKYLINNSVWEAPTKLPLPMVLSSADLHITWASSVGIEAAQLGIKTAMLDPTLRSQIREDYFEFYKESGHIDYIECKENIIYNWIQDNINDVLKVENYSLYEKEYTKLLNFLATIDNK